HGGGWQIGDYNHFVDTLGEAGYSLWVGQAKGYPSHAHHNVSYFRIDPTWETWTAKPGTYAPIEVYEHGRFVPVSSTDRHWILEQIERSAAIISKPGGATLLDSL